MKNEICEFLVKNGSELPNLLEDGRSLIHLNKVVQETVLYLLNIINYSLKDDNAENLMLISKECLNEDAQNCLLKFLSEEKENILNFFSNKDNNGILTLADFDWKFICLSDLDSFTKGEIHPKILLKLIFTDKNERIIESNYSNLKKLQEEIEYCLTSFNSTYTKRIENFSK